jgi:hypothetical protein
VDPDSLNQDPDPAFQVNSDPIRLQGFDDKKLKKKATGEAYSPRKEDIQHFKI